MRFLLCSLAAYSKWRPVDAAGILPLLAVTAMFVGHALGVVPICQLLTAEVGYAHYLSYPHC
jgi:hypothetical protein